ncbi:hypothetical protein ACIBI9_59290 [Nonomuraea sp. NPDC050451]|uniref:hypothetical protein n=1 Tax=Nonomuraea sp. NPDC050451 TaxID=3364364 RepID=UPI0037A5C0E7
MRSRALALATAAGAALLLAAYGCQVPAAPPFDTPYAAAATIEDIAERLRRHVDDGHLIDGQNDATSPVVPLMSVCQEESGLTPPMGVPAYSAELKVAALPRPLTLRLWVVPLELSQPLADLAGRAARRCADEDSTVTLPFDREGWRGTQLMNTAARSPDMGDVSTEAYIVAARGQFLAEASWWWPIEQGEAEDSHWVGQGAAASASALTAVGGRWDGPMPVPSPQPGLGALAAALPRPSAYGPDVAPWTGGDDRSDLACASYLVYKNLPAAVPTVVRVLTGRVTVREEVLLMPDAARAERARRLLVTPEDEFKSEITGKDVITPCQYEDEAEPVRIPYKVEPFARGGWTGEMESFAVRRPELPREPTYKDSVAHVALIVRRGATVVRLLWQGPAGADLAGALREGRAALTRTLDRLPG